MGGACKGLTTSTQQQQCLPQAAWKDVHSSLQWQELAHLEGSLGPNKGNVEGGKQEWSARHDSQTDSGCKSVEEYLQATIVHVEFG